MTLSGFTFHADSNRALWNANQIYNTAVSSSLSPSNGDILKWNGTSSQWEIGTDNAGGTYTGGTGITLAGSVINADSNSPIWNANKLYGTAIDPGLTPSNGQVLKWSSSNTRWEAVADAVNTYTAGNGINISANSISTALSSNSGLTYNSGELEINPGTGLTLSGGFLNAQTTSALWNANQIYNTAVSSSLSPSNGDILKWNGTSSQWEIGTDNAGASYTGGTGITLAGTVINADSNSPIWNANQIYGTAVSSSLSPSNGDILKWNGTSSQWEIGTDNTSAISYTAGTGLTLTGTTFDADSHLHIWNANRLYDKLLPTSAPTNNQMMKYNGTSGEWTYVDESSYQYTAGNGINISSNAIAVALSSNSGLTFNSGDLEVNPGTGLSLSGGVLNAQTTIAQWNADKIQGTDVDTTAPTDRQILMYDNTSSKWVPSALPELQDADGDTKIHVEKNTDEDKIRFDVGGTEKAIIDASGMGIGTSAPSSTLEVSGSYALKVDTTSNWTGLSYSMTTNHNILLASNSSFINNLVVNLPAAASCRGRIYTVKSTNVGVIVINPNGSELIEGVSTLNIGNQYDYLRFVSDGNNWLIIGQN